MSAPAPPTPSTPIVIWTLRGCEAEALAAALHSRTAPALALHEPLNPGRAWGALTLDWIATRDAGRLLHHLRQHLTQAAAQPMLITHSVEMVPQEVSLALAAAASEAGCAQLVLHRQDAPARLAAMAAHATPASAAHATAGTQRLQAVWDALVARGERPLALAHEDVFAAAAADAHASLRVVLERLGLAAQPAADRSWSEALREGRVTAAGQPPRGVALQPVAPWRRLQWLAAPLPPGVLHTAVDTLPQAFGATDLTRLGGVVVTEAAVQQARLLVHTPQGQLLPAPAWHMASPRMAKLYPGSANGAKARFFWRMAGAPDAFTLAVSAAHLPEPAPLFHVEWLPATLADVSGWLRVQADDPAAPAMAALRRTLDALPADDPDWAELDDTWRLLATRSGMIAT